MLATRGHPNVLFNERFSVVSIGSMVPCWLRQGSDSMLSRRYTLASVVGEIIIALFTGGDPCVQPQNQGIGNSVLPRFFFDVNTRQCRQFSYRGTKGNQNNFVSRENCEQQCPVFVNPCSQGQPYMDSSNRPQTCNALTTSSSCPSGYWCHVGAEIDTTVCCPGGNI